MDEPGRTGVSGTSDDRPLAPTFIGIVVVQVVVVLALYWAGKVFGS